MGKSTSCIATIVEYWMTGNDFWNLNEWYRGCEIAFRQRCDLTRKPVMFQPTNLPLGQWNSSSLRKQVGPLKLIDSEHVNLNHRHSVLFWLFINRYKNKPTWNSKGIGTRWMSRSHQRLRQHFKNNSSVFINDLSLFRCLHFTL